MNRNPHIIASAGWIILSLLFLFPVFGFAGGEIPENHFPVQIYTLEDGLAHTTVLSIGRDSCGFLWVQTLNGLQRFDGTRFKSYQTGYTSEFNHMQLEPNGEFWLIHNNQGGMRYDYLRDTFYFPYPEICERGWPTRQTNGDLWLMDLYHLYLVEENAQGIPQIRATWTVPDSIGMVQFIYELPDRTMITGNVQKVYRIAPADTGFDLSEYPFEIGGNPASMGAIYGEVQDRDSVWMVLGSALARAGPSQPGTQPGFRGNKIVLDHPEINLQEKDVVFAIQYDGKEFLYIRTNHGIYRMSRLSHRVEWIYPMDNESYSTTEGAFQRAMYYDPDGILWVGTNHGLVKITIARQKFHRLDAGFSTLQGILVDSQDRLWCGSSGGGLFRSIPDREGRYTRFDRFEANPDDPFSIAGNITSADFEDSRGNIYISSGNWNEGQYLQITESPGEDRLRFRTLLKFYGLQNIYQWEENRWLLSRSTDISVIFDTIRKVTLPFYPDTARKPYQGGDCWISEDGYTYFKTGNAIYRIGGDLKVARSDGEEFVYPGESRCLLELEEIHMNVVRIVPSEDWDEIWLGGKGIFRHYRYMKGATGARAISDQADQMVLIREYRDPDAQSGAYIYGITNDSRKRIWYSTQNGLTCIDPVNEQVTHFFEEDGLPTNKFFWSNWNDRHGNLYFPSTDGLVWFHPDSIIPGAPPKVYITGLRILNEPLRPVAGTALETQPNYAKRVTLPHDQNFLSLEYAAIDYTGTDHVRYKYMLEGLDQTWVDAGKRNMAEYPGLKPGKYTFRVLACNSNGIWNREGASLGVTIIPPFWLRWYSFLFEGILLLMLLVLIIRLRERSLRLRAIELESKVEQQAAQMLAQRQEMDELKSRFYSNISHEFRTPLTLLLGPVEQALSKKGPGTLGRNVLEMMYRNAKRLQHLINQLLDISKLEKGALKLQVTEGNLVSFLRTLANSFLSLAESRKIRYVVDLPGQEIPVWFDRDKVEKILVNLISNAFKFTPEHGEVHIKCLFLPESGREAPEWIEINVTDTGKGIPEDQLHRIFERFYRAEESQGNVEGSGIGLALVKELVELYRGEISVESRDGEGSSFRFRLPVSKNQFSEDERLREDDAPDGTGWPTPVMMAEEEVPGAGRHPQLAGKPLILIVEDNPDLRKYISESLGGEYSIELAGDGRQGLAKAGENLPDLVITDLMMPEMDGNEMCRQLKQDDRTCHIPIIMLTARADRESKLEGLSLGAESYLIKPFDAGELQVRVRSLIEQRKKLWQKFRQDLLSAEIPTMTVNQKDAIIGKLFELLEQHYSEFDFSVDHLGAELHMSRAQFFRKIHALTGQTPNELLRLFRIKKAASMIASGENNITGIMYEVGFRSTSHFARSFRNYYGKNPSEYRDSITGH